jgi:hypothetical protein
MESPVQSADKARLRWLLFALLLAAIGTLLFHPAGGFAFLNWDDDLYLERNPWLREGLTAQGIGWAFTANLTGFSKFAEYWSPITLLTRLADASLFGIDPGAMHITSVLIHVLNAFLLALALHALTGAFWRSAVVAVIFLVHPLNVEPALWLSARKDLVVATFLFLTLLAYSNYAKKPSRKSYALLLAAFIGALMSKPMAVSIPVLLLILDYWPLNRWAAAKGDRTQMFRLLAEKLPFVLLSGLGAALAVFSQMDVGALGSSSSYPWSARLSNATYALATYVRRTFWPDDLAIFYPHTDGRLPWSTLAGCAAVIVGITILALLLARRQKFVLAGWLWFLTGLGPVLGLVQVGRQAMADRYFYTPGIGLLIAVVWGVYALIGLHGRVLAVRFLAAGVAACLAIVAADQVATWRDSETAFQRALAVTRDNYIAHGNLASHYYRCGQFGPAREHCAESLRIAPLQPTAWNNLGAIETALHRDEAAIHAYDRALLLDPNSAKAAFHFGQLLARHGRRDTAIVLLRRAAELEPGWEAPRKALAELLAQPATQHSTTAVLPASFVGE